MPSATFESKKSEDMINLSMKNPPPEPAPLTEDEKRKALFKTKKPPRQETYVPKFLADMPLMHKEAFDAHVMKGESIAKLEAKLREWGYCKTMSHAALAKALTRYRQIAIVPQVLAGVNRVVTNEGVAKITESLRQEKVRLNPLDELERLAIIQRGRVEKLVLVEGNTPALLDSQTKNIGLYRDLLSNLIKVHMDVGLLTKVPLQHEVILNNDDKSFLKTLNDDKVKNEATLSVLRTLRADGIITDADFTDVTGTLQPVAETQ